MTNQQAPEALRLADWLQNAVATYPQVSEDEPGGYCQEVDQVMDEAAAELRRLHAENERLSGLCDKWNSECDEFREDNKRLAALVEAQQPATHVQQSAEIEHVAGDVSKNGPESNMAQQPACDTARYCQSVQRCTAKDESRAQKPAPKAPQQEVREPSIFGAPATCDSPALCSVSRSCAGQFGTKRLCEPTIWTAQPAPQQPAPSAAGAEIVELLECSGCLKVGQKDRALAIVARLLHAQHGGVL